MNVIGQKVTQLAQSSRPLSGAQLSAGGVQTAIRQLSNRLPHSTLGRTQKLNFLGSEDLAPLKQMYVTLKDFSRKFDQAGLAAKEVARFNSACYNLQIAQGSDEIGLMKSSIHSSLDRCIELFEPPTYADKNVSPEAAQALNELTSLKDETIEFLSDYKRD